MGVPLFPSSMSSNSTADNLCAQNDTLCSKDTSATLHLSLCHRRLLHFLPSYPSSSTCLPSPFSSLPFFRFLLLLQLSSTLTTLPPLSSRQTLPGFSFLINFYVFNYKTTCLGLQWSCNTQPPDNVTWNTGTSVDVITQSDGVITADSQILLRSLLWSRSLFLRYLDQLYR